MKNTLILLLSFLMAFTAYGNQEEDMQEKAVNEEEFNALGDVIEEEVEDSRGVYFSVSFSPIITADAANPDVKFSLESSKGLVRTGESPLESDFSNFYRNGQVSLGHATKSGFRYQGGFKWMKFTLGTTRYDRFDFAPVDLETINENVSANGGLTGVGPVGSVYYDAKIGNREGFQDWLYVGTSFGLIRADLNYDLDILDFSTTGDSTAWVKMNQVELGTVLGSFQIGYEWTRFLDPAFENIDGNGSMLNIQSFNRHAIKIGLLHLFKRR